MSSGPGPKDRRHHDQDVLVIIGYDTQILDEWSNKPNANPLPNTVPDPSTSSSGSELQQIREYLEGILALLREDVTNLPPVHSAARSEMRRRILKAEITALSKVQDRNDASHPDSVNHPNDSNPLKRLKNYTKAIYFEMAKKDEFKNPFPIKHMAAVAEEDDKILALMEKIASKL